MFVTENDNKEKLEIFDYSDIAEEEESLTPAKKEVFEWLDVVISAIIVVVILFTFVFRVATIEGPSMQNTLFAGEKVVISNFFYEPQVNDIVVISRNAENIVGEDSDSSLPIIKRIIAVEGQTVDIDFNKGIVYVDGEAIDDSYAKTPTNLCYNDGVTFPVRVPENCVFVLGDNRNDSLDSRSSKIGKNGMVDTRYILGKTILRIYPFDKVGGLE
ncbi:MAG: signal peptidase I [Clostridia bacterium]|nr:signal peptidase I [Clostridia bacterium]